MTYGHVTNQQKLYTVVFKSGHAGDNIQKSNLGLGKVLDGWNIYPA